MEVTMIAKRSWLTIITELAVLAWILSDFARWLA